MQCAVFYGARAQRAGGLWQGRLALGREMGPGIPPREQESGRESASLRREGMKERVLEERGKEKG